MIGSETNSLASSKVLDLALSPIPLLGLSDRTDIFIPTNSTRQERTKPGARIVLFLS